MICRNWEIIYAFMKGFAVLPLLYPIMYPRRAGAKDQALLRTEVSGSFLTRKDRVNHLLPVIIIFTVAILFMGASIVDQVFQVTLSRIRVDSRLNNIPLFLRGRQAGENIQLGEHARFKEKSNLPQPLNLNFDNVGQIAEVQDVVLLPDDEVLFLVRLPPSRSELSHIRCSFSDKIHTQVNGIEYLEGFRAAVRCNAPPKGAKWSAGAVSLLYIAHHNSGNPQSITITSNNSTTNNNNTKGKQPIKWDFMVYQSLILETDIVLFAKGINHKQGLISMDVPAESLRCVFNDTIETIVTVSAQEVFRCEHPHDQFRSQLLGSKITLLWRGNPIPSVAYYEAVRGSHDQQKIEGQALLCACTMVLNVGKYLREWVMYNSHLGVGQFFVYDNNSEDNLQETIDNLNNSADDGGYNVTRYPWPWPKTQESGFSHCALIARDKCQWMMYTDVDEYAFSRSWLKHLKGIGHNNTLQEYNKNITSKALKHLVVDLVRRSNNMNLSPRENDDDNDNNNKNKNNNDDDNPYQPAKLGQISIKCRNFGPSGLREHPERGVTQGYTCRESLERRHKSILLLEAISSSLLNVVHHFHLKTGYTTLYVKPSKAVINHYKYQAWPEFKAKFRRRVSAYVVDWKDSRNLGSQDRTPGLGNRAIEPQGWENRFCEVNDTALRHFTTKVFSLNDGTQGFSKLQWQ